MNQSRSNNAPSESEVTLAAFTCPVSEVEFPFPGWSIRGFAVMAIWIGAVAICFVFLDVAISDWVHGAVPVAKLMWLFTLMKAPGNSWFTLIVAAALFASHRMRWRAAVFLCLSATISGLLYIVAKWCVGRTRPFQGVPPFQWHPFTNGISGLFVSEYHSFPSGHASLAFATAAALSALLPKWRFLIFLGATVTATERILQNAHYMSDVVAGAGFGVLSMMLSWWLYDLAANHYAMVRARVKAPLRFPSSGPFLDT